MVNKPGKPKSKRTPVRLRHKIEKASAAKQRKQRKLAKKDPTWRSRLKKDPGIPNLFPYKERILQDIEEKKRLKEEATERKRSQAKGNDEDTNLDPATLSPEAIDDDAVDSSDHETMDEGLEDESSNPMSALLASARARATEYEEEQSSGNEFEDMDVDESGGVDIANTNSVPTRGPKSLDYSLRAFSKIYKKIIEDSDILLYVLDARDPFGTRSREIEKEIAVAGDGSKRLMLVLNKVDLVPPAVLKQWLNLLRRSFPTLPLRASTPASNANVFEHKALTVQGTSETLLRALKTYSQSRQSTGSTTVGIVGYPNVGKSSVINALTSRLGPSRGSTKACPTGATAGITTALREVKLDNRLKLLDSPGIVFPSSATPEIRPPHVTKKQAEQAHLILLSALPPSAIDDPVPAVTVLLHRLSQSSELMDSLMQYYGITQSTLVPQDGDITTDFLVQVARKKGRLGKGGVPNINAAAMSVLADWRDGRIRGWVAPPAPEADNDAVNDSKSVVKAWAEEFKLEGLWGDDGDESDNDAAMHQ